MPKMTKKIRNPLLNTYLKYTSGNSINGLLLSSYTHPLTPKLHGTYDNTNNTIDIKHNPDIP